MSAGTAEAEADRRRAEILLVEDNEDDLELALRAFRLAKLSNTVHVARDGVEALDFVFCEGAYRHRVNEPPPHLILLDMKLPKVDGIEVLKRIKSDPRTRTIPVILLTSSRQQSDVTESFENGCNAYIVKPINFDQFMQAVQLIGSFWLTLNQPPISRSLKNSPNPDSAKPA